MCVVLLMSWQVITFLHGELVSNFYSLDSDDMERSMSVFLELIFENISFG